MCISPRNAQFVPKRIAKPMNKLRMMKRWTTMPTLLALPFPPLCLLLLLRTPLRLDTTSLDPPSILLLLLLPLRLHHPLWISIAQLQLPHHLCIRPLIRTCIIRAAAVLLQLPRRRKIMIVMSPHLRTSLIETERKKLASFVVPSGPKPPTKTLSALSPAFGKTWIRKRNANTATALEGVPPISSYTKLSRRIFTSFSNLPPLYTLSIDFVLF